MKKFLNLKYKICGRDYTGCDCYGLIFLFYRDFLNIEIPEFSLNYNSLKSISNLLERNKKQFIRVQKPKKFDIILFKRAKFDFHIGVFLEKDRMLHVTENMGRSAITDFREYNNCEKEFYTWQK